MENKNLEMRESQDEKGLSIKDLLGIVRKHLIAIFVFVITFSVAGFGLAYYKDNKSPSYTASASVLICPSSETVNNSVTTQYSLARYLLPSFVKIIQTNIVLDPVAEKYNTTAGSIKSRLSFTYDEDALLIIMKLSASDKKLAADTLNAVVDSVVEFFTVDLKNNEEPGNTEVENPDSELSKIDVSKLGMFTNAIQPWDSASENRTTKASSKTKYTVIFFAVGVVCAIAYVSLREIFDNSFKSSEQVEEELGLRVLASIPLYEINLDVNSKQGETK